MSRPFDDVVAEHGSLVMRVCRGILGPHTDADDAWSETFLAALKAWPTLPADANVPAWLATIAHNKAIDIVRARQRLAIPVDTVPELPSTLGIPGATDADDELWAAVLRLPPRQRAAVSLHYLGGLPYQLVAEATGSTVDATRRAAADGIAGLRSVYRHREPPRAGTAPGSLTQEGTTR
ncbi:MAG: putative sigma factor [Glaciihabitans sp.]|nr:putative sigma factor [Glaciihabitans sp.]